MMRSLTDIQKAATFYTITFALAVAVAVLGTDGSDLLQVVTMLTPTIGVLLMLLVLTPDGRRRSGWAVLAMHRAGWRGWLPALLVPTAVLAASYGAAFLVGAGTWHLDAALVGGLLGAVVLNSTFAVFEEIGWRGYMLPHLSRVRWSGALVGFLQGVWHLPLMLLTTAYNPGGNRWVTVPVFLAVLTGAGVFYAYLRWMSGSLWPVVIAHGTFNAVLGLMDDAEVSRTPAADYLTGETGLFTLAAVLAVAALLTRRRHHRSIERPRAGERRIEQVAR